MKKDKSNYSALKNNLYILKQIHTASPGRIALNLVVIVLKSISNVLFDVYMLRYVINGIQKGLQFKNIVLFILAIAVYHLFVCIFENYYNETFAPISNQKIYKHIQKKLFSKASSVEISCFENPQFYDKYVKAISEASGRAFNVLDSLGNIVYSLFTISAMSFVVFMIDPILMVFALIPFTVSLVFGKKLNKIRYDYNMEMQEKARKRDYVRRIFYLADYAKEVRLANINKVMFKKFYESINELKAVIKKHGIKVALLDYLFIASNDIIVYLGAILYASYKTLISKTMLYGDCVVVINSINSVAWSLRSIVDIFIQFQNHSLYIDNLRYFLDYKPSISENANGLDTPKDCKLTLKNVSFKYDGQQNYSIKNVSLNINPGEKIALVGHNGSGKSTLAKLMMQLYNATDGEILLNDIPIKEYKLKAYRDLFSVVFQDYKVFSMPVIENILLKDNLTAEEQAQAINGIKNAGVYDKIMPLHKQYNTVLTKEFDENGAVLSGGEYQKIAIARVFAKNSPMAILDEPSSALDPLSEYAMYESMMEACKNKAVIFISHRLSSAVLADKVYLMENGEIIESGTHSELLKKGGKYTDMWNKQAEKYHETGTVV